MDVPACATWRVVKPASQPLPASTDGLLEGGSDAIPVRIEIVQEGIRTGRDDGALGFDKDAVWFSGRACSFRVVAPDVLPGAYRLSRQEPVTDGEALLQGLPLRHPTREVWIRMQVLSTKGRTEDERRLIEAVKPLRALSHGEAEGTYPPLTPRTGLLSLPGGTVAKTLRAMAIPIGIAGILVWCVGLPISWYSKNLFLYGVLQNVGMLFCWVGIYGSRDRFDTKRKILRRIGDEEEAA